MRTPGPIQARRETPTHRYKHLLLSANEPLSLSRWSKRTVHVDVSAPWIYMDIEKESWRQLGPKVSKTNEFRDTDMRVEGGRAKGQRK